MASAKIFKFETHLTVHSSCDFTFVGLEREYKSTAARGRDYRNGGKVQTGGDHMQFLACSRTDRNDFFKKN